MRMKIPEGSAPDLFRKHEGEKLPHRVYFVHCPEDDTVLVAMDVYIQDGYVKWWDTVKERMMRIGSKELAQDGRFTFVRSEPDEPAHGREYTFAPMNLDNYNAHVKDRLIQGRDFTSEDDLLEAFTSMERL